MYYFSSITVIGSSLHLSDEACLNQSHGATSPGLSPQVNKAVLSENVVKVSVHLIFLPASEIQGLDEANKYWFITLFPLYHTLFPLTEVV